MTHFPQLQYLLTERDGRNKISIITHPVFLSALAVKVVSLFFFGSILLTENYIPFVNYFINSGFSDPYAQYAGSGTIFPFPALMLYILTTSKVIFGFVTSSDLFTVRVPILIADFAIFIVLIRWLKNKQREVLWYYWCSPIIFAIGYIAGFLDIIPISLLFASLYFMFREMHPAAFAVLGLALATKTGLVILLPFICVYLIKENERPAKVLQYVALSACIYIVANIGYIFDPDFFQMIYPAGQSFVSNLDINFGGFVLYTIPLVFFGLLASSFAFQRLSKDIFLMFIAFVLGTITLFVSPVAGWYSWIVPFFIYFFIKEDRAQKYPFIILNIFFFAYYLLEPRAIIMESLGLAPTLEPSNVLVGLAFTMLEGSLILNIVWIYRIGIEYGVSHKILYKPYLVGIAGDSASGKSTVAKLISQVFGEHNTLEVAGDDMHKWERGNPEWSRFTHLNPVANRLHDDLGHAARLKNNESIVRAFYDHAVGRFTLPKRVWPKKLIVLQGLHALYLNRSRELLDLKIFLSPDEALRRKWKIERDMKERGGSPDIILKQIEERSEDAERYIKSQNEHADIVISICEHGPLNSIEIECDNSIYIDPFVDALNRASAIKIVHEHKGGRQHILITGDVERDEIDQSAYALAPEIWEINRKDPRWESGHNGIIQFFLSYVICLRTKTDHEFF